MKRVILATLMAMLFGLFSMPALQAAPANGSGLNSAIKSTSPIDLVQRRRRRRTRRRRRRRGCYFVHYRRSRTRLRCR